MSMSNVTNNVFDNKNIFGFWIYIMSDCILFATLFIVYSVFSTHIFGGPTPKEIFNIPFVFIETLLLLTSSFTFSLSMLHNKKNNIIFWLWITFILGLSFILMEVYEFHKLYSENYIWNQSAFLSSFFTLIGTHGSHVFIGLIWIITMIFQMKNYNTHKNIIIVKIKTLGLFWHFLDIIWILVFSIVYLFGNV